MIVTPPIEAYSKELQDAAAAEMKAIPGPCPRDTVNVSDCSALKRLVIDYGDLRQRIRAAREKGLTITTGLVYLTNESLLPAPTD